MTLGSCKAKKEDMVGTEACNILLLLLPGFVLLLGLAQSSVVTQERIDTSSNGSRERPSATQERIQAEKLGEQLASSTIQQ